MKRLLALSLLLATFTFGVSAQELRIASYNMERLGQGHKDYSTLASVVASFDVVAAIEIMNERGMKSVLKRLPEGWSYLMSPAGEGSTRYREHFGYFYDSKVEAVRSLGAYPEKHEFFRPPYGAQFRDRASGLLFNLVACHIIYGDSEAERIAEINNLGKVYRYFEEMTGNKGMTIIAGDFNEERIKDFASIIDLGDRDVIPVKGTTIGMRGPDHGYDHMFVSSTLSPRVVSADVYTWTTEWAETRKSVSDHLPVYMVLRTGPSPTRKSPRSTVGASSVR